MSAEYTFDYEKAKPNRFASRMKDGPLVVVLEPDPLCPSDTLSEAILRTPKYDTIILNLNRNLIVVFGGGREGVG